MGRKNLNPENANQLRYKTLGSSFTNLVTKIHLFVCLGSFVKKHQPYVIYSMKLLKLVINLTQYKLNHTDKQLTTYINTKSKNSKYDSNIRHKI